MKWKFLQTIIKKQFKYYIQTKRNREFEFLYTIKLCYELGLKRDRSTISRLQNEIFNSDPPHEPSQSLSAWIYISSSRYYSLYRVAREAIEYSSFEQRDDIIKFFLDKFINLASINDNTNYLFGVFFGRNITRI